MKTYSVKQGDVKRETHVVDVADKILGRAAAEIAALLMGKHKAIFSRNADVGDCVTVINAEKVQVTGKKPQQKLYYWHSNYPGGFKSVSYEKLMQEHPDRVISYAVGGMLPHNHLHDRMMRRLKVYAGPAPGKSTVEKAAPVKTGRKKAEIRFIPIEVKSVGKRDSRR
ncbi:MAG: 50S ribosomal protein L13 [Dehalococcoidales bacterium]|nr:50S ribosomal protein L13 [Dehalococcoidales bacterium]